MTDNSEKVLFSQLIQDVVDKFRSEKSTRLVGTGGLSSVKLNGDYLFFGVHKSEQRKLNFKSSRSRILEDLNLPNSTPIVQVIGDCTRFSVQGTAIAREFLKNRITPDCLVFWGHAGLKGGETADVNQIVNDWLEECPSRFKRAIANIVDFHSLKAITEWGCTFTPENKNFFLVYGNALYGDDIISSDHLTDIGLALEGGVQTFRQIVDLLSREKVVYGIYGLRGNANPDFWDEKTGRYLSIFSAVEFLNILKCNLDLKNKNKVIDLGLLENFLRDYLRGRLLFDARNPAAKTKEALFYDAWRKFSLESLWYKLNNCLFVQADKFLNKEKKSVF
jgi:hypothetical protein